MLAVGIDISKSKSVAAILNQDGSMHTSPFEFHHTQPELDAFIKYILNSKQSATILMENTGHYHYPVLKAFQEAGLPVCMVNAYQIKKFGDMDLRKAKTDKKDAVRIARYALEKSYSLVPYTSMEQKYEDLRFLARQYNQRMLTLKTNKVFLLNLLDETMPGITNILPLTTRTPETSLSVLFINRFKSYDRIKKMGKSSSDRVFSPIPNCRCCLTHLKKSQGNLEIAKPKHMGWQFTKLHYAISQQEEKTNTLLRLKINALNLSVNHKRPLIQLF